MDSYDVISILNQTDEHKYLEMHIDKIFKDSYTFIQSLGNQNRGLEENDIMDIPRSKIINAVFIITYKALSNRGQLPFVNGGLVMTRYEELKSYIIHGTTHYMRDPINRDLPQIINEYFTMSPGEYKSPEKKEALDQMAIMDIEATEGKLNSGAITPREYNNIIDSLGEKCMDLRLRLYIYARVLSVIKSSTHYSYGDRIYSSRDSIYPLEDSDILKIAKPFGDYMMKYLDFFYKTKYKDFLRVNNGNI